MKMPSSAKNPDDYDLTVITSSATGLQATLPKQFAAGRDQETLDFFVAEAHSTSGISRATAASLAMRPKLD